LQKQARKQITLYSDGSSLGNPGPGGYGGILEYKGSRKEYFGGEEETTNNRMELRGVIEGLKLLKEPCDVEVVSDSSYVVKAINEWLESWIRRDFKKVKNVDLWKAYIEAAAPHHPYIIPTISAAFFASIRAASMSAPVASATA